MDYLNGHLGASSIHTFGGKLKLEILNVVSMKIFIHANMDILCF